MTRRQEARLWDIRKMAEDLRDKGKLGPVERWGYAENIRRAVCEVLGEKYVAVPCPVRGRKGDGAIHADICIE